MRPRFFLSGIPNSQLRREKLKTPTPKQHAKKVAILYAAGGAIGITLFYFLGLDKMLLIGVALAHVASVALLWFLIIKFGQSSPQQSKDGQDPAKLTDIPSDISRTSCRPSAIPHVRRLEAFLSKRRHYAWLDRVSTICHIAGALFLVLWVLAPQETIRFGSLILGGILLTAAMLPIFIRDLYVMISVTLILAALYVAQRAIDPSDQMTCPPRLEG
jgi:hypothetical protein